MTRLGWIVTCSLLSANVSSQSYTDTVRLSTTSGWSNLEEQVTKCIAWGDVDGDGDLDLACGNSSVGQRPNRVYLNNAGVLETLAGWTSVENDLTWSLAWGDVDMDGDLDLACGNTGNNRVYLNRNGELENIASWSSVDEKTTWSVAWGDFDADGDLDLACGNTDSNCVYLNIGGVLDTVPGWVSSRSVLTRSVNWIDLDGDGDLELGCGNDGPNAVYFCDGGVLDTLPLWTSSDSTNTWSVAWGDTDNNGYFDLACGNSGAPNVIYFHNGTSLSDTAGWASQESAGTRDIAWGDVDNDGDLDLACADNGVENKVYLNINGVLDAAASWLTIDADFTEAVAWADIDADGNLDLAFGSGSSTVPSRIFFHDPPAFEALPVWQSDDQVPTVSIAFGDMNSDGQPDLACGNLGKNALYLNSNGVLTPTPYWISQDASDTRDLAWGDMDNDGDLDLACGNSGQPNLIYLNDGGLLQDTAIWTSVEADSTFSVAWGDVDNDGDLDLVCGNSSQPNKIYINSDGFLESGASISRGTNEKTRSVAWGDVDGDRDLDLAVGNYGEPNQLYINNNGILSDTSIWESLQSLNTSCAVWADVDGDGRLDLTVGNDGQPNEVYYNRDGSLQTWPSWQSLEQDGTQAVAWGDFDGDGDLDLASGGTGTPVAEVIKINLNRSGFLDSAAGWTSQIQSSTASIAWGDIDGDSYEELAIGNLQLNRYYSNPRSLPCPRSPNLPNTPPCLSAVDLIGIDTLTNQVHLSFELMDNEADRCDLEAQYAEQRGAHWQSATILEDITRLPSSAVGQKYYITWDATASGVDGFDVMFRLRLQSNPDHRGVILRPAEYVGLRIGRIRGKPVISLLYPRQGSEVADSLHILGSIWDPTNFKDYSVSLANAADTTVSTLLHYSQASHRRPSHLTTTSLDPFPSGDYLLRVLASDWSGDTTRLDVQITVPDRVASSPVVSSAFPRSEDTIVPGNVLLVVQFDTEMNQPSVDANVFNVFTSAGLYSKDAIYDYSTRTLTLSPPNRFESDQFYFALVNSQFRSQQGYLLNSEFSLWFRTSPQPPSEAVLSMSPTRGETEVDQTSPLVISFDRLSAHRYVLIVDLQGTAVVLDSTRFDAADNTLTAYPAAPIPDGLQPKTFYLVRISDSPSFDGPSDYMSYFITEDIEMPMLVDHRPIDGDWLVSLTEPVKVVFNKPLNTRSVNGDSFRVDGPLGRATGFVSFGVEGDSVLTFTPSEPYLPGSEYRVGLTSHIQDNIGNAIDSFSWSFTTGVFDTVGYGGGLMLSGVAEIHFPAGAIESDTEVGMGAIPPGELSFDPGMVFTGIAYDVTPAVALSRKAVLSVEVPDSIVTAYGPMTVLKLYYFDSLASSWVFIGGSSTDNNRLSASIERLGRYAVFQSAVTQVVTDLASSFSLQPRVVRLQTGGTEGELVVSFAVSQPTDVDARIYNTSGRLVKTMWSGWIASVGENILRWDGREPGGDFANDGLYVVVIEAEGKKVQKTFVLMGR